jgi:hypothetical protein
MHRARSELMRSLAFLEAPFPARVFGLGNQTADFVSKWCLISRLDPHPRVRTERCRVRLKPRFISKDRGFMQCCKIIVKMHLTIVN